jgi:hypothetical protein
MEEKSPDVHDKTLEHEANSDNPPEDEVMQTLSLDLKLRGCDLAKSSLQELHALQARILLDLQRDLSHTQIDHEVESRKVDLELEEIRGKFAYCQKENRRRQRLLKDAMNKAKRANEREELLSGEVECVRTELFALNKKLSKSESIFGC